MSPLPTGVRSQLERAIIQARVEAEQAADAALFALGVWQEPARPNLSANDRALRVALRARAKALGATASDRTPLVREVAYEGWHRMLFARFLAENGLLRHPQGIAVTLDDCAELAADEGEPDAWMLAARYASAMLPGIFKRDDPSAQVRFAPEGRAALEGILTGLPPAAFTATDALGWVYQFWQKSAKEEVNASGRKIGGADLPAVTQLFTEDYMVRFLLENSLGAWWAARHPHSPLVQEFAYLRFADDGAPAAGVFASWPKRAANVTVMDPCCGSGHFLAAAFNMLRQMRMEEEGLAEADAADAVLRENLFGLEIDARCTQIAAFALALAAWKAGGYRPLPLPNIACSGIPVQGQWAAWEKLAGTDTHLRNSLESLYQLFQQAPDLGSLIEPARASVSDARYSRNLLSEGYAAVEPLLQRALAQERKGDDPTAAVFGEAAAGVVRAADFLARTYTLVATNVPYLARGRQGEQLAGYCDRLYPEGKADLATVFVERCRVLAQRGGSYAVVTPQNWLFLGSYKRFRERLLNEQALLHVGWLGPGAFETISGEVVKAVLVILSNRVADANHAITGLDASDERTAAAKAAFLREAPLQAVSQAAQLRNPDARIALSEAGKGKLLEVYADSSQGICTGDYPRFGRSFWETPHVLPGWIRHQTTAQNAQFYAGRTQTLFWQDGRGEFYRYLVARLGKNGLAAWIRGTQFWGKDGVCINQMGGLDASLYTGDCFDNNVAVIVPHNPAHLPAIWAFCSSPEYHDAVRRIDTALKVTNATLVKVPFDLERWQAVADAAGPLPEPYSNDPTQWLFKGSVTDTTEPLQVAVARLLGYRWPDQAADGLDALSDDEGIACLPAVAGEPPAAERLRSFLAAAYGAAWSNAQQTALLAAVDYGNKGLEAWLRDGFFVQHCKLFHNRPFIWQVWDGAPNGFSALVNYHQLDRALLDKLIYTYLGAWIENQRHARDANEPGAEARLAAAQALQKKLIDIRVGDDPYDIYVRWKPLAQQPIGWNPDLNDGVRLNIRPFVTAGVLRAKFTINWNKDRGIDPDGSERINDRHVSLKEKGTPP